MPATLDQILAAVTTAVASLNTINRKLDVIMSQQDDITADAQVGALKTAVSAVAAIAPPAA